MKIRITPNDKGNPPGKLADAELYFTDGPLEGLKLIGFAIWEKRGNPSINVTFPARQYTINGERRSYALLRPIVDTTQQEKIRLLVIEAYQEYQERQIEHEANEGRSRDADGFIWAPDTAPAEPTPTPATEPEPEPVKAAPPAPIAFDF